MHTNKFLAHRFHELYSYHSLLLGYSDPPTEDGLASKTISPITTTG